MDRLNTEGHKEEKTLIKEVQFGSSEWKREKKLLEGSGYRHANYWSRHMPVTADELRKYALNGEIDAIRVFVAATSKIYYTRDAVQSVIKKLGR